jgi:glyoxylase-like metal-dependent hydrolase (beta-lactamase superfamily II)
MELTSGITVLPSRPAFAFNSYLADGLLVDAGTRWAWRRMAPALRGQKPAAHVLTHAHADHQGSSAAACDALQIPFWVGEADAALAEAGGAAVAIPRNLITAWQGRWWAGPGHTVDRNLREGDAVASFTVLETPGHAAGHIALWRESDRTLLGGDVFFNRHPLTGRAGLHAPPDMFTPDPARNRESMRRLAALRPKLACFGHGPPVKDPGTLQAFVDSLADHDLGQGGSSVPSTD